MKMKRDKYQKQAYAMRRASAAVDRVITAIDEKTTQKAKRWAELWGMKANYRNALR